MESTNTHDSHVNGAVAGIVMLAAIITTYSTYSAYQDDKLVTNYEAEQFDSEQVASVLMSLRLSQAELASTTATTTPVASTTTKTKGKSGR
jgi:hypothetical protein